MMRKFIVDEKLWCIDIEELSYTVSYGKVWGDLRTTKKEFETKEKCEKAAQKAIASKEKSGYKEVLLKIPGINVELLFKVQEAKEVEGKRLDISERVSHELLQEIFSIHSLEYLKFGIEEDLPKEIGQLTNLTELHIEANSIPEEIGLLTKLERLQIEELETPTIPDSIGNLTNLRRLRISRCYKLITLPQTIEKLVNLKDLQVSYNKPYNTPSNLVIPDVFGRMTLLKKLNLSENGVSDLPQSIASLKDLKRLNLSSNLLDKIPEPIFELETLEELDIDYNLLTVIPPEICKLKNLDSFDFYSNEEITNIPKEVLEEGIEEIRAFFEPKKEAVDAVIMVAPENKVELVEERANALSKFHKAEENSWSTGLNKKLNELYDFLGAKTDMLPEGSKKHIFDSLPAVFLPFRSWNFIDERILAYITNDVFYFKDGKRYEGYADEFFEWLCKEATRDAEDATMFQDVIELLKANGLEETVIHESLFDSFGSSNPLVGFGKDGKLSSLGQYLIDKIKSQPEEIIPLIVKNSEVSSAVEFLLKADESLLDKHLETLLQVKEYNGYDGQQHVTYAAMYLLAAYNAEKYETVISKDYNIDCVSCKAEVNRILLENYGDKYRKPVRAYVSTTLKHISESKNESSSYRFNWSLANSTWKDDTSHFVDWICKHFGEDVQDDVFEYVKNTKMLDLKVVEIAVNAFGQKAVKTAGEALNMTISDNSIAKHYKKAFEIISKLDFSDYYDKVWEIAQVEYKDVKALACRTMSKLDIAVTQPKIEELLAHSKSNSREAGIMTLAYSPEDALKVELLRPLLETEKNEGNRNIIVRSLMKTPETIDKTEVTRRVASAVSRKKLSKPITKWLSTVKLGPLKWKDGQRLSEEEVRFLFYRQKSNDDIGIDFEARDVYPLIDPESGAAFAAKLLTATDKNGGLRSANRFAMAIVGILGDDRIVKQLTTEAISYQSLNACKILGLIGTMEAARGLNSIINFYRTKYPNVKAAAEDAFTSIAEAFELSTFELSDKMIPNFDFDGLLKTIDADGKEYTLTLGPDFKLTYTDSNNKALKAIPKPSPSVKDYIKNLNKDIRNAVKQFKSNMELYMVTKRLWNPEEWEYFFLDNPLAFAFSRNFVWGAFKNGKLEQTFAVNEDTLMVDVNGVDFEPEEGVGLGIVHPLFMTNSEQKQWVAYMTKAKIVPPFPQLSRPVELVSETDKLTTIAYRFNNHAMEGFTFKSRSEKRGWKKGEIGDGGGIISYTRQFEDEGVNVFLELEDFWVGFDGGEIKLKHFYFVNANDKSWMYYIKAGDERLIPFGDLPAIVYSEVIGDLIAITS